MRSFHRKGKSNEKRNVWGLGFDGTAYNFGGVQAADYTLDEVVVTATKLPESPEKVPASVSIVTEKEIKDRHFTSVAQTLGQLPGVYLSPIADGGISMRGYGSTDLLVMVDGQPVNSSWNGGVDWTMIPVDNIEKIEVVRGASSSLYGGHAVGGVIQITTKKADEGFHGNALISYGSNNTWKQSYDASIKKDKWAFSVGYEKRKTDGWRGFFIDKAGSTKKGNDPIVDGSNLPESARGRYIIGGRGQKALDSETYRFKTAYHFSDSKALSYSYYHTNHTYVYDNPFSNLYDMDGNEIFSGTALLSNGKYIAFTPSDFLGYVGKRSMDVHSIAYDDDNNLFHARVGYSNITKDGYSSTSAAKDAMTADELQAWNGEGGLSLYPSKSYDFDMHKAWELGQHTVLIGTAYRQESFDQTKYTLSEWRNHNSKTGVSELHGGKGETFAGYIQDKWQATDKLAIYAGVRFDRYKKYDGYGTYLYSDSNKNVYQTFDKGTYTEWSPKFSIEYSLPADTVIYASYGHSFNPPILYQVYRDGGMLPKDISGVPTIDSAQPVIANPDLNPETTDTYELGIRKKWNHTSASLAYYTADTKDTVQYTYINEPTMHNGILYKKGFKWYQNVGDGKKKGVEAEIKHRLNDITTAYLNYAWQDAEVDGEHNYDVPKHVLHFGLEWTPHSRWDILADAQYISARQAPDAVSGEYYSEDKFFITNLSVNYAAGPQTTFQFYVYNLFNKQFYAQEAASMRTYNLSVRHTF